MPHKNSVCLLKLPLTCDKAVPLDSSNSQASFTSKSYHFKLPSARPPAQAIFTYPAG